MPALLLLLFAASLSARQVTVTLLVTTDLHGNLFPVDYYTDQPADRGLAKLATLIAAARRENPNSLLIDCGDTIEGSSLESVYQHCVRSGRLPLGLTPSGPLPAHDPMMAAMNRLGYRAMVLGNHEFNFGLKNLDRARADARFPWISASVIAPRPFPAYIVETVAGVRIAVIGITTPAIPTWEPPEHYQGYRFIPPRQAVESALNALRAGGRPDIVVIAAHMGLGRGASEDPRENSLYDIAARVPGIDAVVFGHTHQQTNERIGDVIALQPKNWGISLGRIDFTLDDGSGGWNLIDKRASLAPVGPDTLADSELLRLGKPYHELTERYLNSPIAESDVAMEGALGRVEDSPLVDAIHRVQMFYAKADVSLTALFNPRVIVSKGPVTVRQVAAVYLYDNDLYAIEGNGAMLRDALENAARYFRSCPDPLCSHGPLINDHMPGYNFDMAQGVEYEIDLTRPPGQRIANLRRNGRPLSPDQPLRIAVNSYRAGGSGGYRMFRGAKILWKSSEDMRSLIIDYYSTHKRLPARADGNWRIVPPRALRLLEQEARAASARPQTR